MTTNFFTRDGASALANVTDTGWPTPTLTIPEQASAGVVYAADYRSPDQQLRDTIAVIKELNGDGGLVARYKIGQHSRRAKTAPGGFGAASATECFMGFSDTEKADLRHCEYLATLSLEQIHRLRSCGTPPSQAEEIGKINDEQLREQFVTRVVAGEFRNRMELRQAVNQVRFPVGVIV